MFTFVVKHVVVAAAGDDRVFVRVVEEIRITLTPCTADNVDIFAEGFVEVDHIKTDLHEDIIAASHCRVGRIVEECKRIGFAETDNDIVAVAVTVLIQFAVIAFDSAVDESIVACSASDCNSHIITNRVNNIVAVAAIDRHMRVKTFYCIVACAAIDRHIAVTVIDHVR